MNKPPEKIILPTSDEAAKQMTVTGWVDRHGRFFGADEMMARWSGATHLACKQCGKPHEKLYTHCPACRSERMATAWAKLDKRPWDGATPVTLHDGDDFFWSTQDFIDWCEDNEVEPEGIRLVHCKPQRLSMIGDDHFADELPEDGKLPPAIAEALKVLNAAILAHTEPVSWWADTVAVDPESLKDLKVTQ